MMYRAVEKLGRAGGPRNRERKQKEWNEKYGEGNWSVVYQYNGKVYTREEALENFYHKRIIFLFILIKNWMR